MIDDVRSSNISRLDTLSEGAEAKHHDDDDGKKNVAEEKL